MHTRKTPSPFKQNPQSPENVRFEPRSEHSGGSTVVTNRYLGYPGVIICAMSSLALSDCQDNLYEDTYDNQTDLVSMIIIREMDGPQIESFW